MSSYVRTALWRVVAARAGFLCKYCLIHEDDTVFSREDAGCVNDAMLGRRKTSGGGHDDNC